MALTNWIKGKLGGQTNAVTPPRGASAPEQATEDLAITPEMMVDLAPLQATRAMEFYLSILKNYELPPLPDLWRDDFLLGFRDAIGRVFFSQLTLPPFAGLAPTHLELDWRKKAMGLIQGSTDLPDSGAMETRGHSRRYAEGFRSALVLQSWMLERELLAGVIEMFRREEVQILAELRKENPNPSVQLVQDELFNVLVMACLIGPLRNGAEGVAAAAPATA